MKVTNKNWHHTRDPVIFTPKPNLSSYVCYCQRFRLISGFRRPQDSRSALPKIDRRENTKTQQHYNVLRHRVQSVVLKVGRPAPTPAKRYQPSQTRLLCTTHAFHRERDTWQEDQDTRQHVGHSESQPPTRASVSCRSRSLLFPLSSSSCAGRRGTAAPRHSPIDVVGALARLVLFDQTGNHLSAHHESRRPHEQDVHVCVSIEKPW